jgi:hypothetical protein
MHTTSTKIRNIQTINFIHTQNINPNFNIAVIFDFLTSLGQFTQNEETHINTSEISLNYTKNKYSVFATYNFNKTNNQVSGGFIDTIGSNTEVPTPFMDEGNLKIGDQELSVTQIYKKGNYKNISYKDTVIKVLEPKISLAHNINFYIRKRIYSDKEAPGSKLFSNFYYQEGLTIDSISLTGMSNSVRFGSEEIFEEKNKFGFSIISESDFKKYFNFKEYISTDNSKTFFENNIKTEIYSNQLFKLETFVNFQYFYTGFRKNDLRTELNIRKNTIGSNLMSFNFNVKHSLFNPDYFEQNFYSNHYRWENDFQKTSRTDIELSADYQKYKFSALFNLAAIKNHIYFGPVSQPLQFDLYLTVLTANLTKTFDLNRLKIVNSVYWQKSSDENIISLPEIALYHSAYLKFKYHDNLLTYFGYDVYYSTIYKSSSFNPAIGQFYFENNSATVIGNYPYVSLFINMKIKKNVMISLSFKHVNAELLSIKYPVQINHYPAFGRLFKFAVRWTFKN